MSDWVGPVLPCFDGTIPNPLLKGVGGWGWWLIMVTAIIEDVVLHIPVATIIQFPTPAALAGQPPYLFPFRV